MGACLRGLREGFICFAERRAVGEHEAELQCMISGAVKGGKARQGPSGARLMDRRVCGADFPLKVSASAQTVWRFGYGRRVGGAGHSPGARAQAPTAAGRISRRGDGSAIDRDCREDLRRPEARLLSDQRCRLIRETGRGAIAREGLIDFRRAYGGGRVVAGGRAPAPKRHHAA